MMTQYAEDFIEGQDCPMLTAKDGQPCAGTLQYADPENCSCHICPPCNACMDVPLVCTDCHWEAEDLGTGANP